MFGKNPYVNRQQGPMPPPRSRISIANNQLAPSGACSLGGKPDHIWFSPDMPVSQLRMLHSDPNKSLPSPNHYLAGKALNKALGLGEDVFQPGFKVCWSYPDSYHGHARATRLEERARRTEREKSSSTQTTITGGVEKQVGSMTMADYKLPPTFEVTPPAASHRRLVGQPEYWTPLRAVPSQQHQQGQTLPTTVSTGNWTQHKQDTIPFKEIPSIPSRFSPIHQPVFELSNEVQQVVFDEHLRQYVKYVPGTDSQTPPVEQNLVNNLYTGSQNRTYGYRNGNCLYQRDSHARRNGALEVAHISSDSQCASKRDYETGIPDSLLESIDLTGPVSVISPCLGENSSIDSLATVEFKQYFQMLSQDETDKEFQSITEDERDAFSCAEDGKARLEQQSKMEMDFFQVISEEPKLAMLADEDLWFRYKFYACCSGPKHPRKRAAINKCMRLYSTKRAKKKDGSGYYQPSTTTTYLKNLWAVFGRNGIQYSMLNDFNYPEGFGNRLVKHWAGIKLKPGHEKFGISFRDPGCREEYMSRVYGAVAHGVFDVEGKERPWDVTLMLAMVLGITFVFRGRKEFKDLRWCDVRFGNYSKKDDHFPGLAYVEISGVMDAKHDVNTLSEPVKLDDGTNGRRIAHNPNDPLSVHTLFRRLRKMCEADQVRVFTHLLTKNQYERMVEKDPTKVNIRYSKTKQLSLKKVGTFSKEIIERTGMEFQKHNHNWRHMGVQRLEDKADDLPLKERNAFTRHKSDRSKKSYARKTTKTDAILQRSLANKPLPSTRKFKRGEVELEENLSSSDDNENKQEQEEHAEEEVSRPRKKKVRKTNSSAPKKNEPEPVAAVRVSNRIASRKPRKLGK